MNLLTKAESFGDSTITTKDLQNIEVSLTNKNFELFDKNLPNDLEKSAKLLAIFTAYSQK